MTATRPGLRGFENKEGDQPVEADTGQFVRARREIRCAIEEMDTHIPDRMRSPSKDQPSRRAAYAQDSDHRVGTRAREFDDQPLPSSSSDQSKDDVDGGSQTESDRQHTTLTASL